MDTYLLGGVSALSSSTTSCSVPAINSYFVVTVKAFLRKWVVCIFIKTAIQRRTTFYFRQNLKFTFLCFKKVFFDHCNVSKYVRSKPGGAVVAHS